MLYKPASATSVEERAKKKVLFETATGEQHTYVLCSIGVSHTFNNYTISMFTQLSLVSCSLPLSSCEPHPSGQYTNQWCSTSGWTVESCVRNAAPRRRRVPPVLGVRGRLLQANEGVAGGVQGEPADPITPLLLRPGERSGPQISTDQP